MNRRERSMKSWRLKIVALTWLQGGHHTAPQYRNSGFPSARALLKAASTSPFCHAMPDSSRATVAVTALVEAVGAASVVFGLGGLVGSGVLVHATSASTKASGASMSFMMLGIPRLVSRPILCATSGI